MSVATSFMLELTEAELLTLYFLLVMLDSCGKIDHPDLLGKVTRLAEGR